MNPRALPPTEEFTPAKPSGDKIAPETAAIEPTTSFVKDSDFADAKPGAGTVTGFPSVPGYEITGEIARGGMGVVYRAIDRAFGREVAVKVVQEGYAGDASVTRRFLDETQITGQLQHPGIPPVHELGVLKDGRPFLVMKLIQGQTLDALLFKEWGGVGPTRQPDFSRFIVIFEQMCQGIAYAHSRGVIHRDLKPNNIMVGAFGETQVMDWGLAKLLGTDADSAVKEGLVPAPDFRDARAESGFDATRAGSILGTPAYMPPEQAAGEVDQVDRQSDVFGLGGILCQVLTGKPPYSGGTAAAVRLQAERGDLAEAYDRLTRCGAEPDLVALAKRCLSADKADRPKDGEEVATAIAAIRAQAEMRARQAETARATAVAREQEQRKRRRALQWATGAIAAVLLAGIIGTSIGLMRANAATDAERSAKEQTQKRLTQIEKSNEIITSIFIDVDIRRLREEAEPIEAVLARRLVKAAGQLEEDAVGDKLVVAALQDRLGQSLVSLGHEREAIPLFAKARATRAAMLGPDHHETLISMGNLAEAYRVARDLDRALPLLEETYARRKATLGADHLDTVQCANSLGLAYHEANQPDKAIPLLEETLRLTRATDGANHPDSLRTMLNLAESYRVAGKGRQAVQLAEETLQLMKARLGADHPDTMQSMNNLGLSYLYNSEPARALPLFEEALRLRKAKLGINHRDTLISMNNLVSGYQANRKADLALPLAEEALKLTKAKLGADHPDTLQSMNSLAVLYTNSGRWELAVPLLNETLNLRKAKLGIDHPSTLISINNLAACHLKSGNLQLALPLFQEAATGFEKRRFQHAYSFQVLDNLIDCYERLKQFDQAELWQRKWLAAAKERGGADNGPYAGMLAVLSLHLLQQEKWTEAETVIRECLAIRERKEPDAWTTFNTQALLGAALLGQKRFADAEPLLLTGYYGMKKREATISAEGKARLSECLERLVALYEATHRVDEAARWRKELQAYHAATK